MRKLKVGEVLRSEEITFTIRRKVRRPRDFIEDKTLNVHHDIQSIRLIKVKVCII